MLVTDARSRGSLLTRSNITLRQAQSATQCVRLQQIRVCCVHAGVCVLLVLFATLEGCGELLLCPTVIAHPIELHTASNLRCL